MKMRSITVTIPEIIVEALIHDGSIQPQSIEDLCSASLLVYLGDFVSSSFSLEEIRELKELHAAIFAKIRSESEQN